MVLQRAVAPVTTRACIQIASVRLVLPQWIWTAGADGDDGEMTHHYCMIQQQTIGQLLQITLRINVVLSFFIEWVHGY